MCMQWSKCLTKENFGKVLEAFPISISLRTVMAFSLFVSKYITSNQIFRKRIYIEARQKEKRKIKTKNEATIGN